MPKPFALVIFGGTGNLSQQKLIPALYKLYQENLIETFTILGLGRAKMTDKQYRNTLKQAGKEWQEFNKHIYYQTFDSDNDDDYQFLCGRKNLLYYLAIPPELVPTVVCKLGQKKLCRHESSAKIIVEKPFGQDQKTAIRLNKILLQEFDENQIYRIDHYLGKETVQNITFFRFGNTIFEPLWNNHYIDNIQITVAEAVGIGKRGIFYEKAGVIRDIVQNHIMQLLCLVAMEPPDDFTADLLRDEKVKVLQVMRATATVIGQYKNYRKENHVSPTSNTSTYFAGKFYIDNKRWSGVPFYVRTGKGLAKRTTEITIEFKRSPLKLFATACNAMQPNTLIFNIQPEETITLSFSTKPPGITTCPYPVTMAFNYTDTFKLNTYEAYGRLLLNCMQGDQTLFARQDEVEITWSIIDPIIKKLSTTKPQIYASGSSGPLLAKQLIKQDKRQWHAL